MSFSNEVKSEIISAITDKDKKYACLYGLIIFCNRFSSDEICFQSESREVADIFMTLVSEMFKKALNISEDIAERKNGTSLYSFTVSGAESVQTVADFFRITPCNRRISVDNIDNNSISNFIAGAFLSCGSITDPKTGYHLEFVINSEELCRDLSVLLNSFGFSAKSVIRKNNYILYIKESENIEDLLTFMGAQSSTLEIINIKILKDVRNRVNRARNCDIANCNKTSAASVNQIQDIRLIESELGLDSLPATLREIAEARLEYPEFSLNDLGEILEPPIGRSGVNHRLKRIKEIADKLREELKESE